MRTKNNLTCDEAKIRIGFNVSSSEKSKFESKSKGITIPLRSCVNHALDLAVSDSFRSKRKESLVRLSQVIESDNLFDVSVKTFVDENYSSSYVFVELDSFSHAKIEEFCSQSSSRLKKNEAAEMLLWHSLTAS